MGNWLNKGTGAIVLEESSRLGDSFTEEFYFADPGGAEIIIEITDASGGGSITGVTVQNKVSDVNVFDAFNFGVVALNAVGRFLLIAYPGPPAAGSYTVAPVNQLMPTQGRIKLSVTGTLKYKVKIRNLGER
jgi:hypothetical protein